MSNVEGLGHRSGRIICLIHFVWLFENNERIGELREESKQEFMSIRRWMLTFDSWETFMLGKPRTIISEG